MANVARAARSRAGRRSKAVRVSRGRHGGPAKSPSRLAVMAPRLSVRSRVQSAPTFRLRLEPVESLCGRRARVAVELDGWRCEAIAKASLGEEQALEQRQAERSCGQGCGRADQSGRERIE